MRKLDAARFTVIRKLDASIRVRYDLLNGMLE